MTDKYKANLTKQAQELIDVAKEVAKLEDVSVKQALDTVTQLHLTYQISVSVDGIGE